MERGLLRRPCQAEQEIERADHRKEAQGFGKQRQHDAGSDDDGKACGGEERDPYRRLDPDAGAEIGCDGPPSDDEADGAGHDHGHDEKQHRDMVVAHEQCRDLLAQPVGRAEALALGQLLGVAPDALPLVRIQPGKHGLEPRHGECPQDGGGDKTP